MKETVPTHYSGGGDLAEKIADSLRKTGKKLSELQTTDLEAIDEFHFRGRGATLELLEQMKLGPTDNVLDIGSGLGGTARTIVAEVGCGVIGLDLTQEFCDAATTISQWVNLSDKTEFHQGDATNLPFATDEFDGAVTIHVAMNIPAKDKMYAEVCRVLKSKRRFAIYDILQGEGGDILFPVPWAKEPSISHLVTPDEMVALLSDAGFKILQAYDSTRESLSWLEARTARTEQSGPPSFTTAILFGDDFQEMSRNQVRNLRERRIRTVSYVCEA